MFRRLAVVLALMVSLVPVPVSAAPTLFPLSSQDWWTPIAQLGGEGHIHVEYRFPIGQTVSGTITLPFDFVLHHNRGTGRDFRIHDDTGKECYRRNISVPTDANGDGVTHLDVVLDTTCMADGSRDFVFSWRIQQADGNLQIVRGQSPFRVENGKPDNNWNAKFFLGGGWYKEASPKRDWGYIHGLLYGTPPTAALSGTWRPVIQLARKPRFAGVQNAQGIVTLDPDFHMGNDGTVLERPMTGGAQHALAIDTTALSNGAHKLVVVSCAAIPSEGKRHCGVLVVPFVVNN
jgi:hypothetical protein